MVGEFSPFFKPIGVLTSLGRYIIIHGTTDRLRPTIFIYSMSIIGQNLKRLRRARGLSQGRLAKSANVSLNTVVKLELGENDNPTLKTMESLARVLGTNLMGLLRKGQQT